jgi:DNA-binding CsgD family transcriptional regulator
MLFHAATGMSLLGQGDASDAEAELRLAARIARDTEVTWAEGSCLVELAKIAVLRGQSDEARTHANAAIRHAATLDDPRLLAAATLRLAGAARTDGDSEYARKLCHDALTLQHDGGYLLDAITTLDALAGLEVERSEHVRAARLFGATGATRRRLGARRRPLDRLSADPDRTQLLRALDSATLRSALREGGAQGLDDAIAYVQRGRGIRSRPAAGWESLTPVELTIARLVADGHSNPEIATRTFVSPATVKSHIRHILAKLAVSNRAELAAHAARHIPPARHGDTDRADSLMV